MPEFCTETAQISIFRLSVGNYRVRSLKCAQNGLKSPDEFLLPQKRNFRNQQDRVAAARLGGGAWLIIRDLYFAFNRRITYMVFAYDDHLNIL